MGLTPKNWPVSASTTTTIMRKLIVGCLAAGLLFAGIGIGYASTGTPIFNPQTGTIDQRLTRVEQSLHKLTLDTNHHLVVVPHSAVQPTYQPTQAVTTRIPTRTRTPWTAPVYVKPQDAVTCSITWSHLDRPEFGTDDLYWQGTVKNNTNQKRRVYIEVHWEDSDGYKLAWDSTGLLRRTAIVVEPKATVRVGDWRSNEERLLDESRIITGGGIPLTVGWTYIRDNLVSQIDRFNVSKCNGYV